MQVWLAAGNDTQKQSFDQAFEQIVVQYEKLVYHTAFGFLLNDKDARDITQIVFSEVYRGYASFRRQAKPETWLYAICKNAVADLRRRHDENSTGTNQIRIDTSLSDEPMFVWNVIGALPENEREVLILRDMEGCSSVLVADMLSCDERTVHTLLLRARKSLKKSLDIENGISSVSSQTARKGGAANGKNKKRGKKKG